MKEISKNASKVGLFTFISRIFGLMRDSFVAYLLGTKEIADAFYVAFRIPNLLRRLLAEGSLTISFVPVFTQYLKEDETEAKKLASATFTLLTCILFVVTLLGVLGASYLVYFTAGGFGKDPQKFQTTVLLTKLTFPYIFFVSLSALSMGVLNSLKSFTAPAASPIFLNLGIILTAAIYSHFFSRPEIGLAIGVLVGGMLQLGIQLPTLIRKSYLPKFRWDPNHPGLKKIFNLILPSVYGSAVYQINLVAITFMASFLQSGSNSFLWYADRIMEFPLGIFAISFSTVVLPKLSEQALKKDLKEFEQTYLDALKTIYFLNVPAMLGLMVSAELIVGVLFKRGAFNLVSTYNTAIALQCFAIGLPFVSATRITSSAFYALQDSKTPVRAANLAVLVNIVMGAILLKPLGFKGLCLGVTCGSFFNFLLHVIDLKAKIPQLNFASTFKEMSKIFISALMMAFVLTLVKFNLMQGFMAKPLTQKMMQLSLFVLLGVFIYALCASLLGLAQVKGIKERLLSKIIKEK